MGKVRIINIWSEQVALEPIAASRTRCYIVTINVGDHIDLDSSKLSRQIKYLEKKKRIEIQPLDFKVKLVKKEDPIVNVAGDPVSVPLETIKDDLLEKELEELELEEALEKAKEEQNKIGEEIQRRITSNGVRLK